MGGVTTDCWRGINSGDGGASLNVGSHRYLLCNSIAYCWYCIDSGGALIWFVVWLFSGFNSSIVGDWYWAIGNWVGVLGVLFKVPLVPDLNFVIVYDLPLIGLFA